MMGPASLALIHEDENPSSCAYVVKNDRFGCFDNEFVISETNANYNFWTKKSTDSRTHKFTLLGSYETEHWGYPTIGQRMSTKKPGNVSSSCSNPLIRYCGDGDRLDVTDLYKYPEPSGPGIPTDKTYFNLTERYRRRMITDGNDSISYSVDYDPAPYWFSPMIVIADSELIMDNYGSYAYTGGMMELLVTNNMESVDEIYVYCSLTVTLTNYRGDQLFLGNNTESDGIVYYEHSNMTVGNGESEACSFNVQQQDYAEYMDEFIFDDRKNLFFTFTLSASIYDTADVEAEEPYKTIMNEHDFMLCQP